MGYSIRIEQIGSAGTPQGKVDLYEADTELEAVALATYEIEANKSRCRRIATVFDPTGLLVLAYAGRSQAAADADRG